MDTYEETSKWCWANSLQTEANTKAVTVAQFLDILLCLVSVHGALRAREPNFFESVNSPRCVGVLMLAWLTHQVPYKSKIHPNKDITVN